VQKGRLRDRLFTEHMCFDLAYGRMYGNKAWVLASNITQYCQEASRPNGSQSTPDYDDNEF
jgi:hypothetical protein